ncbi:hypothetical protein B0H13DRAFT_755837 [Mycena leptocephala]|nr:hypothetical protein B0H13DRAFT_755837 [Mycena leptocephala]
METPRGRGRPKGSKNKKPPPRPQKRTGITCVASHFLVKELPENYPYFCRKTQSFMSDKFQFPFSYFSGPNPPPPDFGSPGDVYVAPAARALYAYLPTDGLFEDGAWTRWSAMRPASDHSSLQPGEAGLLQHPFFPERVLWVNEGTIWWYTLTSVNTMRGECPRWLFAGNEDVAAVTEILVAHTLQKQNGEYKGLSEWSERKRRLDDEPENEEARKKLRSNQDISHSQHQNRPSTATHQQQQPATISNLEGNSLNEQLRKQAAIISGLEEDKAALKTSLDNERRMQATILAQRTSLDEQLRMRAGIIKRGREENAAQQNLLDKRAATIAGLEKEKAALESSLGEQQMTMMGLQTSLDERAVIITRLDTEKAALEATVEEGLRENQVLKTALTERKQKPQSPQLQFLDFMRETFGEEEVIQTSNTQSAVAEARIQIAALQTKIAHLDNSVADPLDSGQLKAVRNRESQAFTQPSAQHNVALRAAQSTIRSLEETTQVLLAEIERVNNIAAQDAASLSRAGVCISDQQAKITTLEAEVARLTRTVQEDTDVLREHTDALRQLLAAREHR